MSELYKRHLYINDQFDTLINDQIVEYDIASAGFNLIRQFKLLPEDDIKLMESMKKKDRQIFIGMKQRKNKYLSKQLNDAFVRAREWFFVKNNIEDKDVVSIKKDAVFVRRHCPERKIGYIEFNVKNVYSSYLHIGNIEVYYSPDKIDIKGIHDEILYLHENYMISFIKQFIYLLETSNHKKQKSFIQDFAYFYKRREVDTGYYREFNSGSNYRLKNLTLFDEDVWIAHTNDKDVIDITYNYLKVISPMTHILI